MTPSNRPDLTARVRALQADVAAISAELDDAETLAGIERGLDEVNRGLGRPAKEVIAELRTKYGLPRT
jgi:predicted transcriptional regulator